MILVVTCMKEGAPDVRFSMGLSEGDYKREGTWDFSAIGRSLIYQIGKAQHRPPPPINPPGSGYEARHYIEENPL